MKVKDQAFVSATVVLASFAFGALLHAQEYAVTDLPFSMELAVKKGGEYSETVGENGAVKPNCSGISLNNGLRLGDRQIPLKSPALTSDCMIETKDYGNLLVKINSATYTSSILVTPKQERLFKNLASGATSAAVRETTSPDSKGENLFDAATRGDAAAVQALLKNNPRLVFSKDDDGNTPLHWAAQEGHEDVAKFLLTSGANVNARNNNGSTPLHDAADGGHKGVAELLLANKAAVNAKDNHGVTPLHWAVQEGHEDVAQLLRHHGGVDSATTTQVNAGTAMEKSAENEGLLKAVWTIKQAEVVALEKLNTGTLVTIRLPLNDPDGVNGVIFLTSQSPFIISKSGTLVFWSGWMDHSPRDNSPALWHPLTPASLEIEIRNKENGEFKINTRAVEKTDVSLKKVNSERLIHRIDDNTIEVSLYFEIDQANIANVGTISYNDSCAQDVDEHKECRVHVLPVKEITDWVRQRRTSAPARKAPVSGLATTQATATHKTAPAGEKQAADAIFKDNTPFDADTYTGGTNNISTLGDNTGTISLYVKDGAGFKLYGQMEIKGTIVTGEEGVLGYTDTFLRVKFVDGDGNWKEIGRKAIKNGRLFIETVGDGNLFTISRISASQYSAVIEPGIHPKP